MSYRRGILLTATILLLATLLMASASALEITGSAQNLVLQGEDAKLLLYIKQANAEIIPTSHLTITLNDTNKTHECTLDPHGNILSDCPYLTVAHIYDKQTHKYGYLHATGNTKEGKETVFFGRGEGYAQRQDKSIALALQLILHTEDLEAHDYDVTYSLTASKDNQEVTYYDERVRRITITNDPSRISIHGDDCEGRNILKEPLCGGGVEYSSIISQATTGLPTEDTSTPSPSDEGNESDEGDDKKGSSGSLVAPTGAHIKIKDWFPQGRDYVFICEDTINATTFDWYFGDGELQHDITNKDVYHRYFDGGEYDVSCTATNVADQTQIIYRRITVQDVNVVIKPGFPQGSHYVFECDNTIGATTFDWNFGDGTQLIDIANQDVWHTYDEPGAYGVTCTATGPDATLTGYLPVVVE